MLRRRGAALAALVALPLLAASPFLLYPEVRRGAVIDDYHGTKVPDPYRWLEDLGSADTKAFVAAQNALSDAELRTIAARAPLEKRLTDLWSYPRAGLPVREGGRLFYRRNPGLLEQSPLFLRESLDAEPRLLIAPNVLSPDGSLALGQ